MMLGLYQGLSVLLSDWGLTVDLLAAASVLAAEVLVY
jgi:hypothetical protein